MKHDELNKMIDGMGLSEENTKKLYESFNNYENSLTARKESAFNEKYGKLEAENAKYKSDLTTATNNYNELNGKFGSLENENKTLKNKTFIYQNINSKMDDQTYSDYNAIIQSRMSANPNLKYEDVAIEVAKSRGFMAQVENPKVNPTPVQETPAPAPQKQVGFNFNGSGMTGEINATDNSSKTQRERFASLCPGRK